MGRKLLFLVLMSGLFCGVLSRSLSAQDSYKTDPLDPAFVTPDSSKFDKSKKDQKLELTNLEKGVKAARSTSQEIADNVLRGQTDLNAAKSEFDRYFSSLVFPSMTQVDDVSLSTLGDQRDNLLKQIQGTPNDSATRKHMLDDLVLPYFSRLASDSGYHPAVRLNAVLIIGDINRREGQRNVEASLPMEAALKVLLTVATAPETPPYLKIGALSGVLRHAIIDGQMKTPVLDNGVRQQAIQLAISVLEATAPADDSKPLTDEQYWMRRQAVQILGAFRAPGADGKAVSSLRKILDDPNAPLWLAADAIDAYGKIRFASPEQADVANAVKSIGMIVSRFFKADVQTIDDYIAAIKENRMIAKRSTGDVSTSKTDAESAPDEGASASGGRGGGAQKGGGAKGGAAAIQAIQSVADVEVPNYKINDVRQRAKSIVFIARRALDGLAPRRRNEVKPPENLKTFADPATAKAIEQMVAALDKVMEQTDLATQKALPSTSIKDAQEKPKKAETNDERLRNSLKAGISTVESVIGVTGPAEQPAIKSAVGG